MPTQQDSLVHKRFLPTEPLLERVKEMIYKAGYNWNKFSWVGSPTPPNYDMGNQNIVIVLYATLNDVWDTLCFYYEEKQTLSDNKRHALKNRLSFRQEYLDRFSPFTLRWLKIDLTCCLNSAPNYIADTALGIEVLAIIAEHDLTTTLSFVPYRQMGFRFLAAPAIRYSSFPVNFNVREGVLIWGVTTSDIPNLLYWTSTPEIISS